ncbi:MAG: SsrA-binding protein SmpB [Planctomycetota bacterium]
MERRREFKNRRAYHEFHVLETLEAGLALVGSEVKSIREGNVSLADSYAKIDRGEVYLVNCHIAEYRNAGPFGHEPRRQRKLLLHRSEIRKLERRVEEKGCTLVPLRVYFNERGVAKVELGVCKGKRLYDKREALKKREVEREIEREAFRDRS